MELWRFLRAHLVPSLLALGTGAIAVIGAVSDAYQAYAGLPAKYWEAAGIGGFMLTVMWLLYRFHVQYAEPQSRKPAGYSRFEGRKPSETPEQQANRQSFADQDVRRFRSELRVLVLSNIEDLMQSYLKCYHSVRDLSRQKSAIAQQAKFSTEFAELAVTNGLQPQFQRITELARAQSDATDHAALVKEVVLFMVRYVYLRRIPILIAEEYSISLDVAEIERWRSAQDRFRLKVYDLAATTQGRDLKNEFALDRLKRFD